MPRLLSARTSKVRTSSSNGARIVGSISTIVTGAPKPLNMQASSTPITPPPTQMIPSGSFGRCQQVSLLITFRPSTPGNGGMNGTEPVARMILSALNCCVEPSLLARSPLVTVTVREASTLPSPSKTSMWLPFIKVPMPPVMRLTTLWVNATTLLMFTFGGCESSMPRSPIDSTVCITSAMWSIALEGMHPTLRQVPPRYCFSTMAVFAPSCAARMAAT